MIIAGVKWVTEEAHSHNWTPLKAFTMPKSVAFGDATSVSSWSKGNGKWQAILPTVHSQQSMLQTLKWPWCYPVFIIVKSNCLLQLSEMSDCLTEANLLPKDLEYKLLNYLKASGKETFI